MDLDVIALKIARNENLPALKAILSQILSMTDDPTTSSRDLEKLIQQDPAISAKLLRAANSSFYGGHSVSSIARAISVLGFDVVRNLIVALSYQQMIGQRSNARVFSKVAYWRHSVATATAARIIGKLKMPMKAEELYGLGIMHDIGLLVLERHALDPLEAACKSAKQSEGPLEDALRSILGYDQAQVGALLAEKWSLPSGMRAAIEHHLQPEKDTKHMETTTVIAISDQIACKTGHSVTETQHPEEVNPQYLAALDISPDQVPVIEQVVVSEVQRAESSFGTQLAA